MNLEQEIKQFYSSICDYGSSDIRTAIETFVDVGLSGSDLADKIREFSDDTDTPIDKIDPCYIAYDHILQMARNKISEVLDFDIVNDVKGDTEFHTYGNYMCTSYDYSTEAQKQLQTKINKATKVQLNELKEDQFVKFFLDAVEIEVSK